MPCCLSRRATRRSRRSIRRVAIVALLGCLALGVLIMWWPWSGRAFVRGSCGDVLAAAALAFALAALWPRVPRWRRLLVALLVACGLELAQAFGFDGGVLGAAGRVALGAVADPFDVIAYAIGVCVAGVVEQITGVAGGFPPRAGAESSAGGAPTP